MSNQSTLDDTELGKFICSHPESSKRVDWERVACLGVGEYATPYLCAECGLPVPSTEPRWTFGKSLLTALVGTLLIVTLGALGIVPWILFGIWALLAIAFFLPVGQGRAVRRIAGLAVRRTAGVATRREVRRPA